MRSLPINLDELAEAMDQTMRDVNEWYLDTQTGQVILIQTDIGGDEDDEEEDDADLPEWQRKAREQVRLVHNDATDRFVHIPENESRDSYGLMEEFIDGLQHERAKDLLARAIDGKGAFRRFKDTLTEFPEIRGQWFAFENQRKREWAEEWLEEIGLK
jgi:hypothetical protein